MAETAYTTDTCVETEALQLELFRQMTPRERIEKMCSLSQCLKKMAFDAIRRRHPEYGDDEIRLAFIELTYGKRLADDVRKLKQGLSS